MLFCSINYKKRGRLSVIFHTYQKNPLVKWLDNRNVTKDCLSHNIFPVRDGKDADLLPKQISLKTKKDRTYRPSDSFSGCCLMRGGNN
ncbi:hypothetical protein DK293_03795 [Vibrio cholerae]|nr:hypothetical protein [Vibrio cholerae]